MHHDIQMIYMNCGYRIEVKVIFAVAKKAQKKKSKASTGFERMTSVIPVRSALPTELSSLEAGQE